MFQKNNLKIINADCMDIMKSYEDNYFDLAIVDPPYGINKKFKGGKSGKMNFNEIVEKGWDNAIPKKEYFEELFRVSKNQIIWGANYFIEHLKNSRCFIVWDKKISEEFSLSMGELAWTSFDKLSKIYRQSTPKNKKQKIHPTQKPIKLYQWILDKYASKEDKILDTHLGSASSAIASFYYGCKEFVGIELDKTYYNASIKRIKEHTIQTKLF